MIHLQWKLISHYQNPGLLNVCLHIILAGKNGYYLAVVNKSGADDLKKNWKIKINTSNLLCHKTYTPCIKNYFSFQFFYF